MLTQISFYIICYILWSILNMANNIFNRLYQAFKTFDQVINIILGRNFPPSNEKNFVYYI